MKRYLSLALLALMLNSTHFTLAQLPVNNLKAYYPFNSNANDMSGYGMNGTVNNATLTTDRFGNPNSAYYFNGTNAYIDLGQDSSINNITGNFTLSYWVNPTSTGGCVFASYSSQGGSSWRIISNIGGTATSGSPASGAASIAFMSSGAWQGSNTAANTIPFSQWTHVAFTRNGTSMSTYINGILNNTVTVSSGGISNPVSPPAMTRLGMNFPSNSSYYQGSLDDIAIYGRALSQSEITQLYNGGSCLFVDTIHQTQTINVYDTTRITVHDTITIVQNRILYDTVYISVTDTLLISMHLTGIAAPNNVNELKVYPNPAKTHIEVNTGNYAYMNGYSLRFINTFGQIVFSSLINQQVYDIDLSGWGGDGLYVMEILNGGNGVVSTKKIILQ